MERDTATLLKNPTALYYFMEVARCGSFRQAATHTHVAASAINRQVKNLESELSTLLFERGRGRTGLRLTSAGEVLVQHLRVVNSELHAARMQIESLHSIKRGVVRVGVNEGLARDFLEEAIDPFKQLHPQISIECLVASSPDLVQLLVNDDVDIAVASNLAPTPGVSRNAGYLIDYCVMVPKSHPLTLKSTVRLSDCASHDFVLPHASLALRSIVNEMLSAANIHPNVSVTTNSYGLMRVAVAAGMGISIQGHYRRGLATDSPEVAFVPLHDPKVGIPMVTCCTHKGRHLPVASAKLLEHIVELFNRRAETASPQ